MTRHKGRTNASVAIAAAIRHATVIVALPVLLGANAASAEPLFVGLCPSDRTCPNGLAEASVLFRDDLATVDPNDFNVTMKIAGNAAAAAYLGDVSFKMAGLSWTDYDVGNRWSTVLPGQPNEWNVYVNLADGHALAAGDVLKLRVQFLNADGRHAGKLSLKGTAVAGEPITNVPEPGTLLLLSIACLGLATISRLVI